MGMNEGYYKIYDPETYRDLDQPPYPAHTLHGNGYLVGEIESFRERGQRARAADLEFKLGLRWISLTNGPQVAGENTWQFSPTGARHVELHYDQWHSVDVDIPEWAVLDGHEAEDVRVICDENDFLGIVKEVQETTYSWPADPTERWDPVDLDGDLDAQIHRYKSKLGDEYVIGKPKGVRVLAFRLVVAALARDDVRVTDDCAAEVETLYNQRGLDVQMPDELRSVGRAPCADVVESVDDFFGVLNEELREPLYR